MKDELVAKGWGSGGVGGGQVFGDLCDLWGSDARADGATKGSWQDVDRKWVCLGEAP